MVPSPVLPVQCPPAFLHLFKSKDYAWRPSSVLSKVPSSSQPCQESFPGRAAPLVLSSPHMRTGEHYMYTQRHTALQNAHGPSQHTADSKLEQESCSQSTLGGGGGGILPRTLSPAESRDQAMQRLSLHSESDWQCITQSVLNRL